LLILAIGLLNLCLGYQAAVWLGYCQPGIREAWESLSFSPGPAPASQPGGKPLPNDSLQALAAMPIAERLDHSRGDGSGGAWEIEPGGQPYVEDLPERPQSAPSEHEDLDERYVEMSILKLNVAMARTDAKVADIDTRLRACQGHTDAETIQTFLGELQADCETHMAEHSAAAEGFHARIDELGELSSLGQEIEMANLEQAAQIETTINNLKYMDFASDLEAANERLLAEIQHLQVVRHRLRDNRVAAFLAVARRENRLSTIEDRLCHDPLTQLRNRIGLEATLEQWWQQGRHKSRQMTAALFDLDAFTRVNEEFGSLAGDRILFQIAQRLPAMVSEHDLAGRHSGQSFLAVWSDTGPRAAMTDAETLRQAIGKTTFLNGPHAIGVTVTCGITAVDPADTPESLLGRLHDTLKQAKAAGPNRAFFHDGKEAACIESPDFGAQEITIPI
jgi:diguanylate cyclase (GGDEF)-like protein